MECADSSALCFGRRTSGDKSPHFKLGITQYAKGGGRPRPPPFAYWVMPNLKCGDLSPLVLRPKQSADESAHSILRAHSIANDDGRIPQALAQWNFSRR